MSDSTCTPVAACHGHGLVCNSTISIGLRSADPLAKDTSGDAVMDEAEDEAVRNFYGTSTVASSADQIVVLLFSSSSFFFRGGGLAAGRTSA